MSKVYHAIQLPLFVTSRVCTHCLTEKPLEAFRKSASGKYGHVEVCTPCKRKRYQETYVPKPRRKKATGIINAKVCTSCHIDKSIDNFGKNPRGKYGYKSECLKCESKRHRKYYASTQQEFSANPIVVGTKKCKECKTEKSFEEFHIHLTYKDRHDHLCKVCRAKKSKEWDALNQAKRQEMRERRRAAQAGGTIGKVSFENILKRDGLFCYICCKPINLEDLTFDHVIPLIPKKGTTRLPGPHTEENLKPTHGRCNFRKGNRLLEEMTPYQRRGII